MVPVFLYCLSYYIDFVYCTKIFFIKKLPQNITIILGYHVNLSGILMSGLHMSVWTIYTGSRLISCTSGEQQKWGCHYNLKFMQWFSYTPLGFLLAQIQANYNFWLWGGWFSWAQAFYQSVSKDPFYTRLLNLGWWTTRDAKPLGTRQALSEAGWTFGFWNVCFAINVSFFLLSINLLLFFSPRINSTISCVAKLRNWAELPCTYMSGLLWLLKKKQ